MPRRVDTQSSSAASANSVATARLLIWTSDGGEAERHDPCTGIEDGSALELDRPRRAFDLAITCLPERDERGVEVLEARRSVVVGGVAQRDADVLELALDGIERGEVARSRGAADDVSTRYSA